MKPRLIRKELYIFDYDKQTWKVVKQGLSIKNYRNSDEFAGKVVKGRDFINGYFIEADLEDTTFIDCDFTFANFYCAYVIGLKFERCRFWFASFSREDSAYSSMGLKDIEFVDCDMRSLDLSAYVEYSFSHIFGNSGNNSPREPLIVSRWDMSKRWSPQLAKNLFGSEVIPMFIIDDIKELRNLEESEVFNQALPNKDRQIRIMTNNKNKALQLIDDALTVKINVDKGLFKLDNELERITAKDITTFEFLDNKNDGFSHKRKVGNKDFQRVLYIRQIISLMKRSKFGALDLLEEALEWSVVDDTNKDIVSFEYMYTIGFIEGDLLDSYDMASEMATMIDDAVDFNTIESNLIEMIRQKIINFYDDRVALISSF